MTKTEQAKAIIAANRTMARKDVLKELVAQAGLTVHGAATYYQKLKKAIEAAPAVLVAVEVEVAPAVAAYEAKVLEVTKMTNKELVDTFNANGGDVKRFADRQSGLKRLMNMLKEKGISFA